MRLEIQAHIRECNVTSFELFLDVVWVPKLNQQEIRYIRVSNQKLKVKLGINQVVIVDRCKSKSVRTRAHRKPCRVESD